MELIFLALNCPNFAVICLGLVWHCLQCNCVSGRNQLFFLWFPSFQSISPKASANLFLEAISFAIRYSRSSMGAILNHGCHSRKPPWSSTYETQTSYWRNCKGKKRVYTAHSIPETHTVALHTCRWKTFAKWLCLDWTCVDLNKKSLSNIV